MIERIDFPKRYPVPSMIMLLVVVFAIAGVMINECSQKQLVSNVLISDVVIVEYTRVYLEVDYTVHNRSRFEQQPNLMLKVYDTKGELLASALFSIKIPAGKTRNLLKIIDKLDRPLDIGEKPGQVTLEVFPRKVL
jgi:hypothetical protein